MTPCSDSSAQFSPNSTTYGRRQTTAISNLTMNHANVLDLEQSITLDLEVA
jgi:hypothetical protein